MWKLFSAEELEFYNVPENLAKDERNMFFGEDRNPFDSDGPWPLVAFIMDEKKHQITTFSICNVSPEFLDYEQFNPLECAGGSLYLKLGDLNNLIYYMKEFATRLPDSVGIPGQEGKDSFKLITSSQKLAELRLFKEYHHEYNIKFYLQSNIPSELNGELADIVLMLSLGPKEFVARELFFVIMSIPKSSLEDPDYLPFNYAVSNILLDRKGLESLIEILSESHDFLLSHGQL
jgi:hypothetical protein